MLVGLVHAGTMSLQKSIGAILFADVATVTV
jgi:Na+/phosphate symporter